MFEELKLKYKMARMTIRQMTDGMERMIENDEAEAPVKALVMIFVTAILAGALLPVGINALKAANTSLWSVGEIATYGVIAIMLIIAVVLLIVRLATE